MENQNYNENWNISDNRENNDGAEERLSPGKRERSKSLDIRKLVGMAMFAALAYGVTFVFRIPVMFLTFDAKDAVITLAALMYGPVSSVIISFLVAFIEFISISSTGVYGLLMNFASSFTFSFVAAVIYKYKKNQLGAIIGFLTASAALVSVMLLLNSFVTPYYMMGEGTLEAAREQVEALIPTLILPFNAAKALLNSAIAMLIYKPVTVAMRRAGLLSGRADMKLNRSSLMMILTASLMLALAVIIFVMLTVK